MEGSKTKRKVSLKYKVWLIALLIIFTTFFLILIFSNHIFEKFSKAEVTEFVSVTGGYEITYLVDEEIFTVFYSSYAISNGSSTTAHNGKLEYIYYQVSDPTFTTINRSKEIILPIIVCALSLLGIIPLTIYEVKKGFKP